MGAIADLLNGIFYALDTPGALTRGAIGNVADLASGKDRTKGFRGSGREMLNSLGMVGENKAGFDSGDIPSFAAEMLVDPLNVLGGAGLLKVLGKTPKAKRVVNALKEGASATQAIGKQAAGKAMAGADDVMRHMMPQPTPAVAGINAMDDPLLSAKKLWDVPNQAVTSEITNRGNAGDPAALLKALVESGTLKPGQKLIDMGGGRYDVGTDYLKSHGVDAAVYDPHARSAAHNAAIQGTHGAGQSDIAASANVLNVIPEKANRVELLRRAKEAVKPGGPTYVSVYPGSGKGIPALRKNSFQANMPLKDYLDTARKIFPDAYITSLRRTTAKGPQKAIVGWKKDPRTNKQLGGLMVALLGYNAGLTGETQ